MKDARRRPRANGRVSRSGARSAHGSQRSTLIAFSARSQRVAFASAHHPPSGLARQLQECARNFGHRAARQAGLDAVTYPTESTVNNESPVARTHFGPIAIGASIMRESSLTPFLRSAHTARSRSMPMAMSESKMSLFVGPEVRRQASARPTRRGSLVRHA